MTMRKRLKKKRCKARFPELDPTKRLDWEDKHIYAFAAKSNFEASYFFEKMVDHTLASEDWGSRAEAAMVELTRLRTVAANGLGSTQVDRDLAMGFVYTRYVRPMAKRYKIAVGESPYDLHAQKVPVPSLSLGR